jgi:hypothetical protein
MPGFGPVRDWFFHELWPKIAFLQGDPMKKWPLAWGATGLTVAWLTCKFSSPALPDPGPLPASVPIPEPARPMTWS